MIGAVKTVVWIVKTGKNRAAQIEPVNTFVGKLLKEYIFEMINPGLQAQ